MNLKKTKVKKIRKKKLLSSYSLSYKNPLHIVRGRAQYIFSISGIRYIDLVNNVCHVGHCHPKVIKVSNEQISMLNINTRYIHGNILKYATELTNLMPNPLKVCVFTCSGSEANEIALRMARNYVGSKSVLVFDHSYHGNTTALIGLSPYKYQDQGKFKVIQKPDTTHVIPLPNLFRGKYRKNKGYVNEEITKLYIRDAKRIVNNISSLGIFLHESILGCAGQICLPKNYLIEIYHLLRKTGALIIADEVQTGFGRIGSKFWAFQTHSVIPDFVVMGKPMGNGFPLGGVVTRKIISDSFQTGVEYFNTFGGNPVACLIGQEVLKIIRKENLQKNALKVGTYLKRKLENLGNVFSLIGDIRGNGLFIGVELILHNFCPAIYEADWLINYICQNFYVLLSLDGPDNNVIKIKPPICLTKEDVEFVILSLKNCLKTLKAKF